MSGSCTFSGNARHKWTARRVSGVVQRFERDGQSFPTLESIAAAGIDSVGLDVLVAEASTADTDALIVLKDGRAVCERYFGRERGAIPLMSVTKAVSSLAIPMLLEKRKIPSLDAPLSHWFPSWAEDKQKAKVTLRHVLTHTSGLEHNRMAHELNMQPDRVAFALRSRIVSEPGTVLSYNNRAMALLAPIISKAAGQPAETFLAENLLEPLGITQYGWSKDRAGNIDTYGGLWMAPHELARIGQLLLQDGRWKGKQVLAKGWTQQAAAPASPVSSRVGLAWFRRLDARRERVTQTEASLRTFAAAGFSAAEKLAPLTGRTFQGRGSYFSEIRNRKILTAGEGAEFERLCRWKALPFVVDAPALGLYHTGWLGQYLLIYPEWNVVCVRMRRGPQSANKGRVSPQQARKYDFGQLQRLVERMVLRPSPTLRSVRKPPSTRQHEDGF